MNIVTARTTPLFLLHEINDLYRLLDWTPKPYRMTRRLDASGCIADALIQSPPGETKSRMRELKEWARTHRLEELAYLMPNDRIDPTEDRAERWKRLLIQWRAEVGLPTVDLN